MKNVTVRAWVSLCAVLFLASATAQADMTFLNTWGTPGSGNGQFDSPRGMAIGPNGQLYVADYGNSRIQVFDSVGTYQTQWGSYGTGNGKFRGPYGLALGSNGLLYVTDSTSDRIQAFTGGGTYQFQWGSFGSGNGEFDWSEGMAIGTNGNLYVADANNARVQVFDANGLYLSKWGTPGSGPGQFNWPTGVAVSPDGKVYVVDALNCRVQVFDTSGNYQTQWGSYGSGNGQFNGPVGVRVGPTGLVYVVDCDGNRIEVFDSAGTYKTTFGSPGSGNGQFMYPIDIVFSPTGMVYVSDLDNKRIQRFFDPTLWMSGTNTFSNPAVGPTDVSIGAGQMMGTSLTLDSTKGLVVGGTTTVYGGGTLTVNGGGTFTSNALTLNGAGAVFQTWGGAVNISGLTLQNGASYQTNSPTVFTVNGATSVGPACRLYGYGAMRSTGGFTNSGTIDLGDGLQLSGGPMTNSGLLKGSGQVDSVLNNTSSGEVSVGSGQSMVFTGAGNTNGGSIQVTGGEIRFFQDLTNAASTGAITGRDATMHFSGGLTNGGGLGLSFGTSDIYGNINNTGIIAVSGGSSATFYDDVLNDGSVRVSAGSKAVFFGAYGGNGVSGTGAVYLEGDLRPGHSPASITFGGDVYLGAGCDAIMELGGTTAGTQYDQVLVAGDLSVDGTLSVVLIDGFTPSAGDAFNLFDGDISGTFATVELPTLSPGLTWDTSCLYTAGEIGVTGIPEPGTMLLLGTGALGGFGFIRRQRKK